MRICLLSDIHSNSDALKSILEHASSQNIDHYYFLGDLIDYGPDPVGVIKEMKKLWDQENLTMINGNHYGFYREVFDEWKEKMNTNALVNIGVERFIFKELWEDVVANWNKISDPFFDATKKKLTALTTALKISRSFSVHNHHAIDSMVRNLLSIASERKRSLLEWYLDDYADQENKFGPVIRHHKHINQAHILVHGSFSIARDAYSYPWHTSFWLYPTMIQPLLNQAYVGYDSFCVISGHAHVPMYFPVETSEIVGQDLQTFAIQYGKPLPLGKWATLINPGSVGQPRDLDTRAAYALLDTHERTVTYFRVDYDMRKMVQKMNRYAYPKDLIEQLKNAPHPPDMPDDFRGILLDRKNQKGS